MILDSIGKNYAPSSAASNNSPASANANMQMGENDFLKLLVTQLRYQDPLNPIQNQDFTAQLAQFSSLEQLTNMNSTLSEMQSSLTSNKNDNILDYIGKTIITSDGNTGEVTGISYKDGNPYLMVGENKVSPDNILEIK